MAHMSAGRWMFAASLLALVSFPVLAGQPAAAAYTTGAGAVANWGTVDYDPARPSVQPFCLYVYQAGKGANPEAKYLENDLLSDKDVAEKLKGYRCIKLDAAKTATLKGWPRDLIQKAKGYKFSVILLSSDLAQQVFFKKNATDAGALEASPKAFALAAENVSKYQEKVKAAIEKNQEKEKEKEKKGEQQADASRKAINVPGLNKEEDKEKKDDAAKKPEPKKPSGPMEE